jgi:hypothetical protein
MSLRGELRQVRRERSDLIRRDVLLCEELEWQSAHLLMYAQIADQLFSLVGWLVRGRRERRSSKR